MRIRDLVAALNQLDPSLEVLAHDLHGEHGLRFFDIEAVETVRAMRWRTPNGEPQALLDDEQGRPMALLRLTSDY